MGGPAAVGVGVASFRVRAAPGCVRLPPRWPPRVRRAAWSPVVSPVAVGRRAPEPLRRRAVPRALEPARPAEERSAGRTRRAWITRGRLSGRGRLGRGRLDAAASGAGGAAPGAGLLFAVAGGAACWVAPGGGAGRGAVSPGPADHDRRGAARWVDGNPFWFRAFARSHQSQRQYQLGCRRDHRPHPPGKKLIGKWLTSSSAPATPDAVHTNHYNKYVTQNTKLVLRRVGPTVDNEGLSFCRKPTCQQRVPTTSWTRARVAAGRSWCTCRRGASSASRHGSTARSGTAATSSRSSSIATATCRRCWRTCAATVRARPCRCRGCAGSCGSTSRAARRRVRCWRCSTTRSSPATSPICS